MREHVDDLIRVVEEYRKRVPLLDTSMPFTIVNEMPAFAPEAVR